MDWRDGLVVKKMETGFEEDPSSLPITWRLTDRSQSPATSVPEDATLSLAFQRTYIHKQGHLYMCIQKIKYKSFKG